MNIYVGDKELKSLSKGTTSIKEVYVGATKIRPKIINFATQGPCPDGFHVPLQSERSQIYSIAFSNSTSNTRQTPYKAYFKMPMVGYINEYNGNHNNNSSYPYGDYWSCSPTGTKAYSMYITTSSPRYNIENNRGHGCTIRAFKNEPLVPDSSWTQLAGSMTWCGIYYNSTEGLISCTYDGSSWLTMMDKNLGATVVYNDGDAINSSNNGNYYQRGNNYGFSRFLGFTTSTSQIDASDYGPKNYYSSDIFRITGSSDWSSVKNDNLRGGVDGNVPVS